jgi:tetratricopeptide (TPR) repeat protein
VLDQVLKMRQHLQGGHTETIAITLGLLGMAAASQEHWNQAELYYRQAVKVRLPLHGDTGLQMGTAHSLLGDLLARINQEAEAQRELTHALKLQIQAAGADSSEVANTLQSLGELYASQGKLGLAETHLRRALEIRKARLGANRKTGWSGVSLALVLEHQHRLSEAEDVLKSTHDQAAQSIETLPQALLSGAWLVRVLRAEQRAESAQVYEQELNEFCAAPKGDEAIQECRLLNDDIEHTPKLQRLLHAINEPIPQHGGATTNALLCGLSTADRLRAKRSTAMTPCAGASHRS